MSLSRGKRMSIGWDAYGWWWSPYGGRRKKRIATKRERRWLKQQLRKEAEE